MSSCSFSKIFCALMCFFVATSSNASITPPKTSAKKQPKANFLYKDPTDSKKNIYFVRINGNLWARSQTSNIKNRYKELVVTPASNRSRRWFWGARISSFLGKGQGLWKAATYIHNWRNPSTLLNNDFISTPAPSLFSRCRPFLSMASTGIVSALINYQYTKTNTEANAAQQQLKHFTGYETSKDNYFFIPLTLANANNAHLQDKRPKRRRDKYGSSKDVARAKARLNRPTFLELVAQVKANANWEPQKNEWIEKEKFVENLPESPQQPASYLNTNLNSKSQQQISRLIKEEEDLPPLGPCCMNAQGRLLID